MKKDKFKVGDRILLISNRYRKGDANPVYKETKVVGTIIEILEVREEVDKRFRYGVKWDNEETNSYEEETLVLSTPANRKKYSTVSIDKNEEQSGELAKTLAAIAMAGSSAAKMMSMDTDTAIRYTLKCGLAILESEGFITINKGRSEKKVKSVTKKQYAKKKKSS